MVDYVVGVFVSYSWNLYPDLNGFEGWMDKKD
jgi:hypothetical protein